MTDARPRAAKPSIRCGSTASPHRRCRQTHCTIVSTMTSWCSSNNSNPDGIGWDENQGVSSIQEIHTSVSWKKLISGWLRIHATWSWMWWWSSILPSKPKRKPSTTAPAACERKWVRVFDRQFAMLFISSSFFWGRPIGTIILFNHLTSSDDRKKLLLSPMMHRLPSYMACHTNSDRSSRPSPTAVSENIMRWSLSLACVSIFFLSFSVTLI
jgi:hypothetical protein